MKLQYITVDSDRTTKLLTFLNDYWDRQRKNCPNKGILNDCSDRQKQKRPNEDSNGLYFSADFVTHLHT